MSQALFKIGHGAADAAPAASIDWGIRNAFEGTLILGGTGSGKTSGSGRAIAKGFLKAGFGGLVMCVKPEERADWQKLMASRDVNRADELLVFSPKDDKCLSFLLFELASNPECFTLDLVRLLMIAIEGGSQRDSQDRFWDDTMVQTLANAIDMIRLSDFCEELTVPLILKLIQTAPSSQEVFESYRCTKKATSSEAPLFYKIRESAVQKCADRALTGPQREDLIHALHYFKQWANMDPRTRSSILAVITSRLSSLDRSPFREMFSSQKTNVDPAESRKGKVIVLDLPVKSFGEAGRLSQVLFKTVWQRYVERPTYENQNGSPVFLWADEAQYFVTEYDLLFQQTARSSRVATVYLTQSIVNLRAAMDEGTATHVSDALTGNFQTKIFHANACVATNQYAESLFGSTSGYLAQSFQQSSEWMMHEQVRPKVPSSSFHSLKRGGDTHDYLVESLVYSPSVNMDRVQWNYLDPVRSVFKQGI